LQAPYVQDSLRLLADRLVRSFISHAALVRPLEEQGKLKVKIATCNCHLFNCTVCKVTASKSNCCRRVELLKRHAD
jgi:hypothetical protein